MAELKKEVLNLAHAYQYQIHPQAVKRLLETLAPVASENRSHLLRLVFSSLQEECSGGARIISVEMMSKVIAVRLQSASLSSGSSSLFLVVPLESVPSIRIDELSQTAKLTTPVKDRLEVTRQRFLFALQRCFRSEKFRRGFSTAAIADGATPLLPISSLEGIANDVLVSVVGIISRAVDSNAVILEDDKQQLTLDLDSLVDCDSHLGNAAVVVASGYWTGSKLRVTHLHHPPAESRLQSNLFLGGCDTFGLAPPDMEKAMILESQLLGCVCVVLAHVHLDVPRCLLLLSRFFREFETRTPEQLTETCFVLVGDFVSVPWTLGDLEHLGDSNGKSDYQALFDGFCSLMHQHAPTVAQHASFIFVPGPNDPTDIPGVLPQTPLPTSLTGTLTNRLRKVTLASNPCRLRFCSQEIIFCRKDFIHDLRKSSWKLKQSSEDLAAQHYEVVTKTICDAAHLAPLDSNILWRYDNCLRLLPLPHLLVACDKSEQWHCKYRGTNVINPGNFTTSGTFLWYTPCDKEFQLNQVNI